MNVKLLTETEKTIYANAILQILTENDAEFIPPLSKRSSTTQKNLSDTEACENGIQKYCAELLNQQVLGAFENDELLGFVSFKENFTNEIIASQTLPNIYVSTVIVKRSARGNRLTPKMYARLFDELYPASNVFTRTWSTNIAHSKILAQFGFNEFFRIPNDRDNFIDTVYYARQK